MISRNFLCLLCKTYASVKTANGSTTAFKKHTFRCRAFPVLLFMHRQIHNEPLRLLSDLEIVEKKNQKVARDAMTLKFAAKERIPPRKLCEGETFREALSMGTTGKYTPPGRRKLMRMLKDLHRMVRTKVREMLRRRTVSLQVDGWKSRLKRVFHFSFPFQFLFLIFVSHFQKICEKFFAIFANYLDDNKEHRSVLLGVLPYKKSQTGENLALFVQRYTHKFRIEGDEIVSITTDSEAKMGVMCRALGLPQILCGTHRANLHLRKCTGSKAPQQVKYKSKLQ